jgi:hypothetical protein
MMLFSSRGADDEELAPAAPMSATTTEPAVIATRRNARWNMLPSLVR